MEKIAREKLFVRIICVALATILWLYVSYQENPSMTKTVKNVPLVISGEQALKESGFSVYSISEKSIDVKVTAKRLSLARLTNRTISAVINVSSIKKSGTYVLPATVNSAISSNASYYVKGRDISVVIEPIESKKFTVEADIKVPDNMSDIFDSCSLNTDEVKVSAPKSILKEIASVKTEPFSPDSDSKTDTFRLIVYGKNGKILEGAECSPGEVKVSYTFRSEKMVPVVFKTSDGGEFNLPANNSLKIYGSGEEFDRVTKLETKPIDINSYEAESKINVPLKIPEGIWVEDNMTEIEITTKPEYYKDNSSKN